MNAQSRAKKVKWLFTMVDELIFAIAGLWRPSDQGEAFTMLTCEPGADVAPYHSRQVAVLGPDAWARWLTGRERRRCCGQRRLERCGRSG